MWFYLTHIYSNVISSVLLCCVVSQEESSTGFRRTSVTWTLCSHGRLWTLSRWVSPRQVWSLALQHGKAISCLAKPALWSGSPNLETITVGLPASAAQRLHRFNKSVHIGWGRGSPSVTQQKRHLQRMCMETKQVIGREKGTRREIKATGWWVRCGGKPWGGEEGVTRMMCWVAKRRSVSSRRTMCLQEWSWKRGRGGRGQVSWNRARAGLAPLSAIHLMLYSLTGPVAKGHPGA